MEESILPDASALGDQLPEVVNDLDWDFEPDEQTTDVGQSSENQAKLKEKVFALLLLPLCRSHSRSRGHRYFAHGNRNRDMRSNCMLLLPD